MAKHQSHSIEFKRQVAQRSFRVRHSMRDALRRVRYRLLVGLRQRQRNYRNSSKETRR
jgi:hypothetical protein